MALKIKLKKGRPLANLKIRSIKGITPRGFKIHKIQKKRMIFKKNGK